MKVLVVGSGAHGGWLGSRLIQAGVGVTFLVGTHQRASELDRHGLVVRSPNGLFQCRVKAKLPSEISQTYDLVVFANRAQNASIARAAATAAVGPATIVTPLFFNLLQTELLLEDEFGSPLGAISTVAVTQERDGSIRHFGGPSILRVGSLSGDTARSLGLVQKIFEPSEIDLALSEHIRSDIWIQFVRSAAIAASAALLPTAFADPMSQDRLKPLFGELIKEGLEVGRAMKLLIDPLQSCERLRLGMSKGERVQYVSNANFRAEAAHNFMVLVRQSQDASIHAPNFERAYRNIRS